MKTCVAFFLVFYTFYNLLLHLNKNLTINEGEEMGVSGSINVLRILYFSAT